MKVDDYYLFQKPKMVSFEDRVALLCLDHYNSLPKTGKPTNSQWTILSCIIEYNSLKDSLKVVSLGTGSKCLGRTQMSTKGDKINDSHSEVIARRGFIRYIYEEIMNKSTFLYDSEKNMFCKKDHISYHFFSTQTPCGDASIFPKSDDLISTVGSEFITDKKRKGENIDVCSKKIKISDIYRTGAKCLEVSTVSDPKKPGAEYHVLGVIRTKPGRGDPTLSVSCSDKLSRWNIMGVQGALLSLIIDKPIYLESIIISKDSPMCLEALYRAVIGRWAAKELSINSLYKINLPKILTTSDAFKFTHAKSSGAPCPSGILWVNTKYNQLEVIVNGSKQGVTKSKLKEGKGAPSISKRQLYEHFITVMEQAPLLCKVIFNTDNIDRSLSYYTVKSLAKTYQTVWKKVCDSYFGLWTSKPMSTKDFCLE